MPSLVPVPALATSDSRPPPLRGRSLRECAGCERADGRDRPERGSGGRPADCL